MSERLITLSNVPGRQFTVDDLLGFQKQGVNFSYYKDSSYDWTFDCDDDFAYSVTLESMDLFNKLANPVTVATVVPEELVIPDHFTFRHGKITLSPTIYTARVLSDNEVEVSWNDFGGGSTNYKTEAVSKNISEGLWHTIVEIEKTSSTFEELKSKLEEAKSNLIAADLAVIECQTMYNKIEKVTKAILFEDCGSTEGWEDNVDLGIAAIKAMESFQ